MTKGLYEYRYYIRNKRNGGDFSLSQTFNTINYEEHNHTNMIDSRILDFLMHDMKNTDTQIKIELVSIEEDRVIISMWFN